MARLLGLLLVCAGLALAQGKEEEEDESGISIDEVPEGPEEEAAKPGSEPKPAARTTAFPAREPGKKVATVAIRKKAFSLALPADWVLQEVNDSNSELSWEVLLPGSSKRAALYLLRRRDGDPRSYPYYQAEWFRKEKPEEKTEVLVKPCPRLVVRRKLNETDWVDAFFCVSVRNNMFQLQLSCSAADFEGAEADMLGAVRSFAAEVELWPPIPKGYETSDEGTWLVAKAPAVTASITPLVKALKDAEKRFRREHGPVPKGDAPIVVLVHASKAQGAKIEPWVGESSVDFADDTNTRRLFAIPFAKENRDQEGFLAFSAHRLLFAAKYGDTRPDWVCSGEASIARAECYGKPLPSLDEGFVSWLSTLKLHRLDGLDELRKRDNEAWGKECLFQVAALREGKYKKQYRAFLDDFAETGDGLGAFDRQLGAIDRDEILAAANHYISTRIKEEKRKG